MYNEARPPNPSDGSTKVAATEGSGEDPPSAGAARATVQTTRSKDGGGEHTTPQACAGGGEPESPSSHPRISGTLGVFQTICHFPRRQSSGYFSFESDSLPNSPLSPKPGTADKTTQTTSPTGQVMNHALQRMAEAHGGGPGAQRQHANPSDTQEMQAEAIGRHLRLIGDDYNRHLLLRRETARHRQDLIPLNLMPHIQQEPVAVLCVSLLLLLFGRIVYLQGNNHDPQV
ncbi:uncharacterized protein FYW49_008898 [Xenentodon cancila]